MNRIFNAVKIFTAAIFLLGVTFTSAKVSAADFEAMQIFRETIMQTAGHDNRPFHQDIYFLMPKATGNLEFLAAADKGNLKVAGTFGLWLIDEDGNADDTDKEFYLVQDKENMTLYFQDEKNKWKKSTSPISAANMIDMITTPDAQQLEKMIEFVKDVIVLQDGETSRTLLVKLDGAKIVEDIKAEMAKDPKVKEQNIDETVNAVVSYIENGFRNADIWYTWTVDKVNWQTTTMSFNLSSLPQSIAMAALNDSTQPFVQLEPIRDILEKVAYYSEFKLYTNFLNDSAKAKLEIPKKVLKAKEVESDDKSKKK